MAQKRNAKRDEKTKWRPPPTTFNNSACGVRFTSLEFIFGRQRRRRLHCEIDRKHGAGGPSAAFQ